MADDRPGVRRHTIGLRLALSSTVVALVAVVLLAGLTAVFATADISHLTRQQRSGLTGAVAASAAAAWERAGGWRPAELSPILGFAAQVGADAEIRDGQGHRVASSPRFASDPGRPQFRAPVVAGGHRVGTAVVRFSESGLTKADRAVRTALLRAIAGAAVLAALAALLTGFAVARWITRPVGRLIAVTRAMGRGDRGARAGLLHAPGELQELATAFDTMADTLQRQEQSRRGQVADIAHELRAPIATLLAGHEALLDGVTEPTPDQLASLRDEALRLTRMVTDLQTLAAADAAALQLTIIRCDLADIAAGAVRSLRDRFEAAGIALDQHLTPVQIRTDPDRLRQVVTNLLTNALKFTPAGGRVSVRTGASGRDVTLQVTDTGVGIPASDLPHIFDRFWRGEPSAQTSGSGIGLAVAAGLARALGGHLAATSRVGYGTQMTLTLPRT